MEPTMVHIVLGVLVGYFCGSIPTAVWWGRAIHGVDVREHGSNNAGATNTFRVLGAKAGIPVLLIDIAKSFLPAFFLPILLGVESGDPRLWFRLVITVAAVFGHLYPVFARFKGGKGVATSLGGILAIHPAAAAICVGVFLVVFVISHYVSLGSLVAAFTFPLLIAFVFQERSTVLLIFSVALSVLVFYTHRQNIGRLIRGEENKMKRQRSNAQA